MTVDGSTSRTSGEEVPPISRAEVSSESIRRWAGGRRGIGWNAMTGPHALVVSIRAPEVEVELYSAVANRIAAPVVVEV